MNITSVIFDMDGVMIDSEPQWAEAQIIELAKYGVTITEQDCEKYTRGTRVDQLADIWIQRFNLKVENTVLIEAILDRICYAITQEGVAMEGLYELLDYLKSKNLRLAVATSSPNRVIQAVFERLNITDYFEIQCTAFDEEYGKPHPAVYLRAVEKLGVLKHECLVIEDTVTGLIAAKSASLTTLLVNPNYQQDRFAIADGRFSSLLDVVEYLKQLE
ncbi:HAD-IA family hydrolase [Actinobacillus equuli subsp. equuli]|uniref:HAD family hydrolase n=1 Tax=Actinobacillus equuli TaxID=718 RepID=UPI0024419E31|nr:HAD-IA family hydrolase [Actinobacillus equuli]WGE51983.1 HAD-IA family hydrolase [Actinobacillus equuli subsp. haemolyticus]WGE64455.1 HAD-IA family hydrolase [Actinobacillus equuli subsp. equuli]WGE72481.1 HAD-IA family hydrolase [Actinobacillus equuli subsp. haemolyticus]